MAQSCHTHDIGQVLGELKLNPYTLPPHGNIYSASYVKPLVFSVLLRKNDVNTDNQEVWTYPL